MDRIAVIDTKSRGRMVVATGFISAGTVVVLEDPVACVPFSTSSIAELNCSSGKNRFTSEEKKLRQSTRLSQVSSFSGNMCMLAARFYLFGNNPEESTNCGQQSKARERFQTIRNHMTASQSAQLMGLNECAALVQRLISQTVRSRPVTTTSNTNHSENDVVSIAECTEILCKLCCNLFTITDDFQNEAGIGCYPRAALLNHSCEPNCVQSFDARANIVIRTVADVPRGAELCISYTDTGYPTWYRQQELLRSYHFHCTCSRCTRADWNDEFVCGARSVVANDNAFGDVKDSTSSTSTEYAAWLSGCYPAVTAGTSTAAHDGRVPVLPELPLPRCNSPWTSPAALRTSTATKNSSNCNSETIRRAVREVTNSHSTFTAFTASPEFTQYTPPEQLYAHIVHHQHTLRQLSRIVSSSNYCVYHVRKQLKIAFEERLPVHAGVLLFPPLAVRAAVKSRVAQMCKSSGSGSMDGTHTTSDNAGSTVVVYTPAELRVVYEDNLKEALHAMPLCYSPTVPNRSYTFYRIQYVWFMLSKADSLVAEWRGGGACGRSSSAEYDASVDVAELRRLAAQSAQLLRDVEVVFGRDHMFYADVQHCAMQLQRVCLYFAIL